MPIDLVDEVGDESFPASDPPAWTGLHAGDCHGPGPIAVASIPEKPPAAAEKVDEGARVEHPDEPG